MPKIIVCYKWVVDEQDIRVNQGTQELDFSRTKKKISDYDKNAIEIGTQIWEKNEGSTLVAVSYGDGDVKSSLKDALSRGPEEAFWINDDNAAQADSYVTANAVAAAIKKIGDFDMVLCADGSSDVGNQQFANRVAALLDVPAITATAELTVEGTTITAKRRLGDQFETVSVAGPAVYSVLPEVATPRFPSIKQLMGAKKKPQTEFSVADLGLDATQTTPKTTVSAVNGYTMVRKNIVFNEGEVADQVKQLADALAKEGLL